MGVDRIQMHLRVLDWFSVFFICFGLVSGFGGKISNYFDYFFALHGHFFFMIGIESLYGVIFYRVSSFDEFTLNFEIFIVF